MNFTYTNLLNEAFKPSSFKFECMFLFQLPFSECVYSFYQVLGSWSSQAKGGR